MRILDLRVLALIAAAALAACGTDAAPLGEVQTLAIEDAKVATDEDTPITVTLTIAPADAAVAIVAGPANGALEVIDAAAHTYRYAPKDDFNGEDEFTFSATLGEREATGTATITVTPVNDAPAAAADTYAGTEDTALTVAAPGVLENDADADGDALAAELVSPPAKGSVTLNADGSFAYVPYPDTNGSDSFTYKASDGRSAADAVTVSLVVAAVNDAPGATAGSSDVFEDTQLSGTLAASDADGDALTFSVDAQPLYGVVTITDALAGTFTYDPAPDFYGADSFTFRVYDGAAYSTTVSFAVNVEEVNDAPVATGGSSAVDEDTVLSGYLAASDVEGNLMMYEVVTVAASGNVVITSSLTGAFTYTPNADFNGYDVFAYRVTDGAAYSNTATFAIAVTAVNDLPVGYADAFTTDEDTPLVVAAPGVLANDTDVDGETLTAVVTQNPANGTLGLNADGSFTYTPGADFSGADMFRYRPRDATLTPVAQVTVTLTVNNVNDAPTVTRAYVRAQQDRTFTGSLALHAADAEGQALTFEAVTAPVNAAAFTLNPDGNFTYTPAAAFVGGDMFGFRAYDGEAYSSAATVTVVVEPWAPIEVLLPVSGPTGRTLTIMGHGFGDPGTVTVGGVAATLLNWTSTEVVVVVPAALGAGDHTVQAHDGAVGSNTATYKVVPYVASITPAVVNTGETIDVYGSGLGASGTAYLGGQAAVATSWSNNLVQLTVPAGATGYEHVFIVANPSGLASNSVGVTVRGSDVWITDPIPTVRGTPSAVWTGNEMIIWGGQYGTSRNDGGRYDPAVDAWRPLATQGAPRARNYPGTIWTGTEMIVWGGYDNGTNLSDGARYNPSTDSWAPVTSANEPAPRYYHTMVWTGSEAIVYGGIQEGGGRYDPLTDTWTPITGGPPRRYDGRAVWTGEEMFLWGGSVNSGLVSHGDLYNPLTDTWRTSSVAGAPPGRSQHGMVWTGDEAIVFGGYAGGYEINSGGRYNPALDQWAPISMTNVPQGRREFTEVWTGEEMIVFGGYGGAGGGTLNTGGRYNPATNTWTATPTAGVTRRDYHASVWTGTEMIVWGGRARPSGERYNPQTNTWASMADRSPAQPLGTVTPNVVWTGSELIYWGGMQPGANANTGARYTPATDTWTPMGACSCNGQGYAVVGWTGDEMLVWGGYVGGYTMQAIGKRYHPATDSWGTMSATGAPEARLYAAGGWTGDRFVVWGGYNSVWARLGNGARYDPVLDTWAPMTLTGAPAARVNHATTVVGGKFFVFGGYADSGIVGDGGLYDPALDQWAPLPATDAPSPRQYATALTVAADKVLVWGGASSGALYDLTTDTWTAIADLGAPSARSSAGAAFDGTEVYVWGGQGGVGTGGRYHVGNDTWAPMSLSQAPSGNQPQLMVWTGSELLITMSLYESAVARYLR